MTDQSPRDALAYAIAKTIRPDMHDRRWHNFVRLTDKNPDDPEWAADLPVRHCRNIADAVLAWLAEPGQVETMISAFVDSASGEWVEIAPGIRAAVAALRGKP